MKIIARIGGKDYAVKYYYPSSEKVVLKSGNGNECICNIKDIERIMLCDWDEARD